MNLCNGNSMMKISRQEQHRLGKAPIQREQSPITQCLKLEWAVPEDGSRESYPHLARETNGHSNLFAFDQIQSGSL